MYNDVNINLERRDTEITDALLSNFQTTQVIEDTHVIITAVTPKFEDKVKYLEDNFSEFKETNLFAEAVSSIPGIVDKYLANQMNEAVKAAVQLQSDKLREEAQAKNEDFINKIDENRKKIIKEQVKVQVKEQVSKIFPRIEKSVNEQLEAKVLTRSSNEAKTSHAVAANLSELEPKKILIDKMENNKSINRSVQQKTLYKALVDAYETDKYILATYGDIVTFKRRRDDKDEDEESFAGSTQGSKRRKDRKEPESTSAPKVKTSKSTDSSKEGSKSKTRSTDKFAQAEEQVYTINDFTLAWNEDPRESFNELIDTPLDFLAFVLNQLKVDTLTLELLAGLTFELMKGSCKSLVELEYFLEEVYKATTDQLDWINPEGQQYPHDLRKPLPLIPNLQVNKESARDVYSRNRIIAIKKLTIVEWHNYKHLEWITVRKLTNLNIEERLALGVSLRMFTRSIVIKRRVEDLQLGIESYQKKLNITKPDTYRSDLKRKTSYTTYSNPRGFIYQNQEKKNILMRIDELHKFSDDTLNDVRSALDDTLKRIRIKYLPQTIWREVDRERAGAMIQAID
ncbi:hypothetical protein Tco_0241443 [Tanacetum coccineum]